MAKKKETAKKVEEKKDKKPVAEVAPVADEKSTPTEDTYVFVASPKLRKEVVGITDVAVPAGPRKRVVTSDRTSYILNEEEMKLYVTKK